MKLRSLRAQFYIQIIYYPGIGRFSALCVAQKQECHWTLGGSIIRAQFPTLCLLCGNSKSRMLSSSERILLHFLFLGICCLFSFFCDITRHGPEMAKSQ